MAQPSEIPAPVCTDFSSLLTWLLLWSFDSTRLLSWKQEEIWINGCQRLSFQVLLIDGSAGKVMLLSLGLSLSWLCL